VVGLGERQPCLDEEDTAFAEDIAPVAVRNGGLVLDPLEDKKPEGTGMRAFVLVVVDCTGVGKST
jgi:hypothetical protein